MRGPKSATRLVSLHSKNNLAGQSRLFNGRAHRISGEHGKYAREVLPSAFRIRATTSEIDCQGSDLARFLQAPANPGGGSPDRDHPSGKTGF
jgi:hypothetical protein